MLTQSRSRRAPRRRPATVQALERGLRILDVLADEGRMPLAQIARVVDLHLSTAHHLMKTLEGRGYVAHARDRSWELSGRVYQLAAAAWNADDVARLGEATVAELGRKTGEATQLAVFDRRHVIVVSKFDRDGPERLFERLGAPRPAYCTALGKALLAWQQPSIAEAYLTSTELKPLTPKTIISAARVREELRKIRRAGVAVDDEEFSQGIRCLAAPVFNFSNGVAAALGMFGPVWRVSPQRVSTHSTTVARFAQRLSRELGYRGAYPLRMETE
jgi:DNA-binding IclR family transcriptional regulator